MRTPNVEEIRLNNITPRLEDGKPVFLLAADGQVLQILQSQAVRSVTFKWSGDNENLERFTEGDLLGFLLKLDDEQAELASWRLNGPAIIKGGPGTGKSTIALHRVKSLLDRAEEAGVPAPRILFTTYTNALTRFSDQLLRQLLGDKAELVEVSTADHLARRIVERVQRVPDPIDPQSLHAIVNDVKARFTPPGRNDFERSVRRNALASLRTDFLLDEFEWVIGDPLRDIPSSSDEIPVRCLMNHPCAHNMRTVRCYLKVT